MACCIASHRIRGGDANAPAGKQFITNPSKTGRHPTSYFDPAHKWVFDGVTYVDKQRYAEVQLEKKKGFLSSDFSRRDEFSKDFATNQYRERLKMEAKHTKHGMEAIRDLKDSMQAELPPPPAAPSPARKKPLYDLVFDASSAPAVKHSMRAGRDTNNPTQINWTRNFGALKLSSHELGYGVPGAPKAEGTAGESL